MKTEKISSTAGEPSKVLGIRKSLPVFRVGIWIREEDGTLGYVAEDVPSANAGSAVGYMLLHLRATDPRICIRPDGISVMRIPGELEVPPTNVAGENLSASNGSSNDSNL